MPLRSAPPLADGCRGVTRGAERANGVSLQKGDASQSCLMPQRLSRECNKVKHVYEFRKGSVQSLFYFFLNDLIEVFRAFKANLK